MSSEGHLAHGTHHLHHADPCDHVLAAEPLHLSAEEQVVTT